MEIEPKVWPAFKEPYTGLYQTDGREYSISYITIDTYYISWFEQKSQEKGCSIGTRCFFGKRTPFKKPSRGTTEKLGFKLNGKALGLSTTKKPKTSVHKLNKMVSTLEQNVQKIK